MTTCTLTQMYIYNMWRVVASQRKHVAADQPKCHVKQMNSEKDCDEEAVVQQKTNARHLRNGHVLLIGIYIKLINV